MKKLSLLLLFFVFSCQSIAEKVGFNKEIEEPISTYTPPVNQFESRDLYTLRSHKKQISVALFLPLSGKQKELGINLANSAFMSLFKNDKKRNIKLVLFDSKGTPKGAKLAFKRIIDSEIKIVIGPVFSSSIKEIKKEALRNNITVISLSNNRKLMNETDNYGGIFLSGMMPEAQIDRIVSYSLDNEKLSFAIISPNNQYGNTVTALFKKIVKDRDGDFITSEFYKPNNRDLDRAVNRVINSFAISSEVKSNKDAVIVESDKSYPQVIMIPESGKVLSKIIASLEKQNIEERDFQIIGTSQWDDISTLNNHSLNGAWFAAPDNNKFREFEQNYFKLYNKFPPRISSITYDTVSAIIDLVKQKNGKVTPNFADFINYSGPHNRNGFDGIDGLFRFLPNGLVQRNLAVLEVDNGKFKTIDQPVEKFLRYQD